MSTVRSKSPISQSPVNQAWRVLIVDDHQVFRNGLRGLLESEPNVEICGEAENEREAVEKFRAADADFVSVDISLSAGHGLNVVKQIKKEKPLAVVLVISMFDGQMYAERALDAGASGYVCKQAASEEIVRAFREVRAGRIYLGGAELQRMLRRNATAAGSQSVRGEEELSDRELEILTLIGQGRTTHQISESLHLATSTVETYRERLKTKLGLRSGVELTRYAIVWAIENV